MRNHITVHRTRPLAGAIIGGIDLSRPLAKYNFSTIQHALVDHRVFFRDQILTEAQHIAFAGYFGQININRFFKAVDGYPQTAAVRKEPEPALAGIYALPAMKS